MSKHTYFSGQPILTQLLQLIPRSQVRHLAGAYQADRYCKRFFTWDHLVSMLFACLSDCQSLREVTTGMLAAEGKLRHAGLSSTPRRSTLAEANQRRDQALFGDLYHALVRRFYPDSRRAMQVVDSTTVSLFSDILANAGRPQGDGRRKGGVKVHTMMSHRHGIPSFVVLSAAARHDSPFLRQMPVEPGSIVCFDKGYWDYALFEQWSPSEPDQQIWFVTRLRAAAVVHRLHQRPVSAQERAAGVGSDWVVRLGHPARDQVQPRVRLIEYYDAHKDRSFTFVSNSMELSPLEIARIYRQRWAVELLFKRIKGAYPLKYFLGESANAIKIQLWCILICDLLIHVLQQGRGRRWSYRNLRSMIRLHLLSYVELTGFLQNPRKALLQAQTKPRKPPDLFT